MVISSHAAQRFAERVRPGLSEHDAAIQLRRLVAVAEPVAVAPAWVRPDGEHHSFLLLTEHICLPLKQCGRRLVATTCLVRDVITPGERRRRNRLRAARTAAVRARSRSTPDHRPEQEYAA